MARRVSKRTGDKEAEGKENNGITVYKKYAVPTDEQLKEALEATGGVQTAASAWIKDHLGLVYKQQRISDRISKSEMLQEAVRAGRFKMADLAEVGLFRQIKSGNLTAIIFYLKCHAKERGYFEKSYNLVEGKMDVNSNAATHLSDEDLKKAVDKILEKG